jgi:vacuolar-type H+-ATPase subunit E/Vma4
MQSLGSPASVIAAIREDAEAEAERLRESTESEVKAIRADAASMNVAIADREERLAAARRAIAERIAAQEWEGRCAIIEQREQWMQRVVAKAQETWATCEVDRLDALIREARARMPSGACEIAVSAADRERITEMLSQTTDNREPTTITIAPIAGGCIVTVGDVSFDNSFEARSRRLEPEWRNALSGMYTP